MRAVARRHRAEDQVCVPTGRGRLDLDDGVPTHMGDARSRGRRGYRDCGYDAWPYRYRDGIRALHRAEAAHLQGCAESG